MSPLKIEYKNTFEIYDTNFIRTLINSLGELEIDTLIPSFLPSFQIPPNKKIKDLKALISQIKSHPASQKHSTITVTFSTKLFEASKSLMTILPLFQGKPSKSTIHNPPLASVAKMINEFLQQIHDKRPPAFLPALTQEEAWAALTIAYDKTPFHAALDVPSQRYILCLTKAGTAFSLHYGSETNHIQLGPVFSFDIEHGFGRSPDPDQKLPSELAEAFKEWKKWGRQGPLFPGSTLYAAEEDSEKESFEDFADTPSPSPSPATRFFSLNLNPFSYFLSLFSRTKPVAPEEPESTQQDVLPADINETTNEIEIEKSVSEASTEAEDDERSPMEILAQEEVDEPKAADVLEEIPEENAHTEGLETKAQGNEVPGENPQAEILQMEANSNLAHNDPLGDHPSAGSPTLLHHWQTLRRSPPPLIPLTVAPDSDETLQTEKKQNRRTRQSRWG